MECEFRIVVEKVSVSSQKVLKRDTIKIYDIKKPESILGLGLRHHEQISLLSKVQSAYLAEQSNLIDTGYTQCPNCGEKLYKNGFKASTFHAVFSDHQLRIQKHKCKNPDCRWQSSPSTVSIFESDTHPDLVKLQCEQGALQSYREAQDSLERFNCGRRSCNNHVQIKDITNRIGATLSHQNQQPPAAEELPVAAQELIVQVDGGHIPTKDKEKRSFEALAGVVYRPSSVVEIDQHHRQITDKICTISALDDGLQTMKTYLHHAALRQGLSRDTHITALADGADNCWATINSLDSHCQSLEAILDWFHIAKKFQNVINAMGETLTQSVESAKWSVWHGKADEAINKLFVLQANITDEKKCSKLKGLSDYLKNNQAYLVNYDERQQSGKVFTSQVAECHIENLINARHKRKQKMQWTREGAHNVLQIRALMASNEWEDNWLDLVMPEEKVAV